MSRLKTSNHKLRIETGRYTIPKTPIEDCICLKCSNSNEIEDEIHFILSCKKFFNQRKVLFSKVFNDNIKNANNECKFI